MAIKTPSFQARLTDQESLALIDVIEALSMATTSEQFFACTAGPLRELFPHQSILCAIGCIAPDHVQIYQILANEVPQGYIEELTASPTINSPLINAWLQTREPQLFDLSEYEAPEDNEWVERFKRFDLRNAAAHGVADMHGVVSSYFGFYRLPEKPDARHAYLLKLLVPHLHVALIRIITIAEQNGIKKEVMEVVLTELQQKILHWMHKGKSNWEIAQILGTSEANVKYHIRKILAKLRVNNRTQAIFKALGLSLIHK